MGGAPGAQVIAVLVCDRALSTLTAVSDLDLSGFVTHLRNEACTLDRSQARAAAVPGAGVGTGGLTAHLLLTVIRFIISSGSHSCADHRIATCCYSPDT